MRNKHFILDRIEENTAFLESDKGSFIAVNLSVIPKDSNSGDCFIFENGNYVLDEKYTKARREQISDIKNRLCGNNKH